MGAQVTGTASGRNADLVRGLGADEVLDYTQEDITSGEVRYDVVFDAVNVLTFRKTSRVLRPNGVFVTVNPFIGRLSPGWLSRFRGGRRIRSFLVRPDGGDLEQVGAWISADEVSPVVDEKLAAEKAESPLDKADRPMG
jgi:NADPH:quinone reductase-like Zn-dependent oxidoreductase